MIRTNINIDLPNHTITVSKTFNKKASKYGSYEYSLLRKAILDNPDCQIVVKAVKKNDHKNLTFKKMEEYINSQPNCEANLKEYNAVKIVAEAKGAKYPLTKKWFFQNFPEYSINEVSESEIGTSQDKSEHITNINEDVAA